MVDRPRRVPGAGGAAGFAPSHDIPTIDCGSCRVVPIVRRPMDNRIPAGMKILVVIPCLNEAANIERLLRQLSRGRGEMDLRIVVADGGSVDGTRDIVRTLTAEIPDLVLIENPKRLQSAAINLAVERFGEGRDYLIRIDAHGDYPDDYCWMLIAEALALQADSVVVGMKTFGIGLFQKATAVAQNSS